MEKISAILLAAGESRRTGRENKLLLPFKNKSLIRHVAEQLVTANVHEIIVVIGCQAKLIKKELEGLPVNFVENRAYSSGMTSSIHAGLDNICDQTEGIMICLSDMPLLKSAYYNALVKKYLSLLDGKNPLIVRPVKQEKKGHPLIFSPLLISAFLDCQDPEGCRSILIQNLKHLIEYPISNPAYYTDIDTIKDYYKLVQ